MHNRAKQWQHFLMQPEERRVRKKKLAISYFDTAGDQTERLGEKKKNRIHIGT